jgi:L-malate glycosyltransferase
VIQSTELPGQSGPIKVLHVVYALQPGGMEYGVVKLVNGLDPSQVRSGIVSTKPAGVLKHMLAPHVSLFELQRRDGNDPRLIWELYTLFRREQPDVVHTHAWGTLVEGLVAAKLARVPVLIHGEHGTLQLRSHQRFVQRRAWAAVDRLLSVSSRLAERMAREADFPLARIHTIRNGVDLPRFGAISRAAAREQLRLPANAQLAVTVGRLVPVKDHLTLIEAVALLRRQGADAAVAIAGDGPLKAMLLERAGALGIADATHLLGHRPDVEVVLAAADIFALTSVSEGLSNTILEAMASGLPVVATRVGGADELVEDGVSGILATAGSSAEIADAMARLFEDSQRRVAMGLAARARVEAEFSLPGMVQRYGSTYLELVTTTDSSRSWSKRPARSGVQRPGVV